MSNETTSSIKFKLQLLVNSMASRLLLENWKPTRHDYEKAMNQIKEIIKN